MKVRMLRLRALALGAFYPSHWVFVDILPHLLIFLFVANNAVIKGFLPYGMTGLFCHMALNWLIIVATRASTISDKRFCSS